LERKFIFEIKEDYANKTVKEYARQRLGFSSRLLKKLKQTPNGILVNNQPVFVTHVLKGGDVLEFRLPDEEGSARVTPTPGALDIIFEDEDLLVVNKPAPLPVHPTKGHETDTLANIVAYYYATQNINMVFRCVNRIDSGTTGVVILAKNAFIHEALQKQQETGRLLKEYLAIVEGNAPSNGEVNAPIAKIPAPTIARQVSNEGQQAITRFTRLQSRNGLSLLLLQPITGRTHQIRVHMAHIGLPLLGDWLYGTERADITRPALHCHKMSIDHPITKERLAFAAPIPADFKRFFPSADTQR